MSKVKVNNSSPSSFVTYNNISREEILAITPTKEAIAMSTDGELFVWILGASEWREASINFSVTDENPDIGPTQDNDPQGFGLDYLHNKKATNFGIGKFNGTPYNGAIDVDMSTDPNTYRIYLNGEWNDIIYDLTMDDTAGLIHAPFGSPVKVRSGDSKRRSMNNLPILMAYGADIGGSRTRRKVYGGKLGED